MKRETGWEVIGTALAVAVSVLMVALLSGCRADGTEKLRRELEKAVEGVDARVGIAVLSLPANRRRSTAVKISR